MKFRAAIGAALVVGVLSPGVSGQPVTVYEEYAKHVQRQGAVATLGDSIFGDRVSLYTGSVEFIQTDVSLPGNDGLQVAVGRRFRPLQESMLQTVGHFADWDLEIPHLHGVFASTQWVNAYTGTQAYERCTHFTAPPIANGSQGSPPGTFDPGEYWHGNFLYLPGAGDEEILRRDPAVPEPSDMYSYPLATKSGIALRCLSSLAATSQGQGEGFEAVATDGTRYRFDHMVSRLAPTLEKPRPGPIMMRDPAADNPAPGDLDAGNDDGQDTTEESLIGLGYRLYRWEVWILPTQVTDRFGNTVAYQWNASDPWRLDSITSSDGRMLSLSYSGSRITSVTDGARTWTYSYVGDGLSQVALPDGRAWSFSLGSIRFMYGYLEGGGCAEEGLPNYGALTGTMTHPSGAQGTFALSPVKQGRSWVPLQCMGYTSAGQTGQSRYPAEYIRASLTSKQLSGPGLPPGGLAWTYSYGPPNNCYQPGSPYTFGVVCTLASPTTRAVTVTAPDGGATRYTFGNRFAVNDGHLLQVDEGWDGSNALRTTTNTYALPDAGPYPEPVGFSIQTRSDSYLTVRHTPLRKRQIAQQGGMFTWEVASDCAGVPYCFDTRARPTKVVKSGSP